jgi:hypothetical protein
MTVCESKVFYDTEFEATIAAAHKTYEWGEEMEAYQCKNHWHIAHVNPKLWGKYSRKRLAKRKGATD